MNRWLFLLGLGALLSAARAELPVDLPPDTATNRPGAGINVPAPLRGGTETNPPAQPAPEPVGPPTGSSRLRLYPPPRATNDWLRLQDQDALPGRFLGWEDGAVRWEVADALRPVRFRGRSVNRWVWAATAQAAPGADRWVVRLTDGSLLTAQEARLEDKTVVAMGTVAGPLRLPRETVAALYRNPHPAGKGRILHNIEDWELVGAAGPREGVVVNYYGGGRLSYAAVLPPEPVLLEFDWPRTDVQVRLPLPSFHDLDGENHVLLEIGNNNLQAYGQAGRLGAGEVTATRPRGERPRVGVALHPGTGSLAVYVDGKLAGKQQAGAAQRNVPQPQGISVQDRATDSLPIPAVLITPIQGDLSLPDVPGNADLIRLSNGEARAGTLTGLTATNLSFTGPPGALELPLERLVGVVFATEGRAAPRRRDKDVQLHFHDGGQLIAELKEVTADQVIVESGALGRAKLPRASVQRLQLGLNQPDSTAASPEIRRETQPGVIGLRGGSLLNGQLVGVTPQTLMWQLPHALDPLEFALTNVVFANLAATVAPTNPPPLAARVRLANGDQLRGELVGVDAQSVHFRPWHTAPLRVLRRQVAEVRPGGPPEGVLDAGPIENWKIPPLPHRPGDVIYVRSLPLPPRIRLQFEIEPLANELLAMAWLYSRVPANQQRPTGYLLLLRKNSVSVGQFVLSPDGQLRQENTTSHGAPGLGERPVSEMTWLLDTVKGEAFVLLEGKQIGLARRGRSIPIPVGPAPLPDGEQPGQASTPPKTGLGRQIRIEMPDSARSACLRSVLVSEWKGGTDFVAPAKADAIRLHDFTLLAGPIEGVRDGMVHRAGQDPVPVARVSALLFNPAEGEPVRRAAPDVRVMLWNGDELTLAGLQWVEGGMTGTSAALGEVSLPANAIRRLNFRPYDPPPPPSNP